uniref:Uncharacterized protein n=1 Tax=Physcomitrium patens TaxID=3218 RepID=A0A2K1J7J8_PHYPA|nr:hypothetical protein PHYPA_020610 [Physcomitrium patens]
MVVLQAEQSYLNEAARDCTLTVM